MSEKRSMKFLIFNKIINNVFNDKINKLKLYNKKFM